MMDGTLILKKMGILSRCVEVGECLVWMGYCQGGVPAMRFESRMWTVRRALVKLSGQALQKGMVATTSCGCKKCVHPNHIITISKSQLMKEHATHKLPIYARGVKISKGKRTNSRLNELIAKEIRDLDGPNTIVGKIYGISAAMVAKIRHHKSWKIYGVFTGLFKK